MTRILVFIVVGLVVYLVLRAVARSKTRAGRTGSPPAEVMVTCTHCGVNLPRSEALEAQGNWFCCEEHRRLRAE